jgi:peptidoglycan/LPS O-acetylase OafA/YrhL
MWVYLLHVPIITVLWGLPLPQPVRLTIALVTSFGLSLAAKAVFDRLSDGLMRAKAPTRPLASKAEGTGVDLGERDF